MTENNEGINLNGGHLINPGKIVFANNVDAPPMGIVPEYDAAAQIVGLKFSSDGDLPWVALNGIYTPAEDEIPENGEYAVSVSRMVAFINNKFDYGFESGSVVQVETTTDGGIALTFSPAGKWSDKQNKITAAGILKGDGAGGVSDAVPGTDYLTEAPVTSVNGKTGAVKVREVPSVTTADNGKFLQVVSGAWAAVEIANANGGSF